VRRRAVRRLFVGRGGEEVFDGLFEKRSQDVRGKRGEGVVVGKKGRKDEIFVVGVMIVVFHCVIPFQNHQYHYFIKGAVMDDEIMCSKDVAIRGR
jgi:hypothetical protein